ncbi:MAG: nitroreductase family protein [Alistipes sp.]|nr:nitroreductase family protein [Alistipes sp.]
MRNTIFKHKSVRRYKSTPLPDDILKDILEAATRASTVGNMQLYSLVVTCSQQMREKLAPCHFNQPMVTQAPCLVTVCADVHRFSMWCRLRGAEPAYDNFAWFVNAATDALLAAQNLALEAEYRGLGICFLGTTIYTAAEISKILSLPDGVIPVTTVVIGYPDESPALTDRLPTEAVVHYETYSGYTAAEIDELWAEREESEQMKRIVADNGEDNLAKVFTEHRYRREDNLAISRSYFELLKRKGFFNN